jgi:hypothetical protein
MCCGLSEEIEPSGIDGPYPELHRYDGEQDMLNLLHLVIERLVGEAVSPNDIAVLGTRSQGRTMLQYGEKIGPFRLVEKHETGNDIVTMTMNRYKGLEAPVIILCELDDSVYRRDRLAFDLNDLLYVGMTRPTGKLIVLATGEVFEFLKRGGFRVIEDS